MNLVPPQPVVQYVSNKDRGKSSVVEKNVDVATELEVGPSVQQLKARHEIGVVISVEKIMILIVLRVLKTLFYHMHEEMGENPNPFFVWQKIFLL